MDLEGSVQVTAEWDGHRIRAVRVRSARPDVAQTLLGGRRGNDAEALLPRVFSICARAQAAAIATALDAARGTEPRDPRDHQLAVLAEVALEYLWRLQIDLPALLGLPQRTEALARLRRALGHEGETAPGSSFLDALRTAIADECAELGQRFDRADPAAFTDWEAASEAPAARLLRALRAVPLAAGGTALLPHTSELLLREIGDALDREAGYARHPIHSGVPAECGALARLAEHPLLRAVAARTSRAYRRILARWLELAAMPERLARVLDGETIPPVAHSAALAPGCGIAGVETARGLLVHAVTLAGDRISEYRIVAPTEWNFHPAGALPADLANVPAAEPREVEQRAALAVQSLDPCVRHSLEIERRDA